MLLVEETNFYSFKKQIKKYLASEGLFVDNINIDPNVNVIITFHASSSSVIKPTQYYILLNNFLRHRNQNVEEFKIINDISRKLILLDNGDSSLKQKPTFRYVSKNQSNLDDVFADFQNHIKKILHYTEIYITKELNNFMCAHLIKTQEKLLGSLVIDKYESIDTTLTIQLPKKDEYRDITFKLNMDNDIYFLVGEILVEFDEKNKKYKYNYEFNDLDSYKKIMMSVVKSVDDEF